MGYPSDSFFKSEGQYFAQQISDAPLRAFLAMERRGVELQFGPEDEAFWREVRVIAADLGDDPAITLRSQDVGKFSKAFLWGQPKSNLRIEPGKSACTAYLYR